MKLDPYTILVLQNPCPTYHHAYFLSGGLVVALRFRGLLLPIQNVIHGYVVRFAFALKRRFLCKVSYTLCISRITHKTIVYNLIS